MTTGDTTAAGIEMLASGFVAGLVPVHPDQKGPIPSLAPRGVKDATADPVTWRQWLALWPDLRPGVVWPDGLAVLDSDGGDLDPARFGIDPATWAERTPGGGVHRLVTVPPGTRPRMNPDGVRGELRCGPAWYTVMSPAPGYRPFDVAAPILPLAPDSPLLIRPQPTGAVPEAIVPIPDLLPADRREARRILALIESGPYRERIAEARHDQGIVGRRSDADAVILANASWWCADHPRRVAILASLLELTSHKLAGRRGPSRDGYIAVTVAAVLDWRDTHTRQRLVSSSHHLPPGPPGPPGPQQLISGTRQLLGDVPRAILAALATPKPGVDWQRIDVRSIASSCGVNRKTVTRHIDRLERDGVIETRLTHGTGPGHRLTWRLARLREAGS